MSYISRLMLFAATCALIAACSLVADVNIYEITLSLYCPQTGLMVSGWSYCVVVGLLLAVGVAEGEHVPAAGVSGNLIHFIV